MVLFVDNIVNTIAMDEEILLKKQKETIGTSVLIVIKKRSPSIWELVYLLVSNSTDNLPANALRFAAAISIVLG